MKIMILVFLLLPVLLFAFIENLQYDKTIIRGARYVATLLEHNGKLFVDAKGAIEEYNITPNGNLELNSFIPKTNYTLSDAVIVDDVLYVGNSNNNPNNSETFIYRIDISGDEMQLIDIVSLYTDYGLHKFDANTDYFFFANAGEITANILERETMEFVTTINVSEFFEVAGNYLFVSMINGNDSRLYIYDISDIYNPIEINYLDFGEYQQSVTFYFKNNHLFIGQNSRVMILDISDIENPFLLTAITNIPSVPETNHFTDIVVYNDILTIKNMDTMLWLYDISDIENPQFISLETTYSSATSFKESMLIHNNYLYLSSVQSDIMQFDADQLPDFSLTGKYGKNGYYHFFDYHDPYLFLNNPYSGSFMYFNVYDEIPVIDTLYTSTSSYCFNDSLLCFLKYISSSNSELVICSCNEDEINIENSIILGNYHNNVQFVGEHLIITEKNAGNVKIHNINPDYSLELLNTHSVEISPFVPHNTSHCTDDYIYIISKNYSSDLSYLNIYENFGDFIEISCTDLDLFGNSFSNIYRLSDEKSILFEYQYPNSEAHLCNYSFPDQFEQIDMYNTTGNFKLHDDFLVWNEDLETVTKMFSWQNDEFQEIFSYDFSSEISDIFIIPGTNILYACGSYIVLRYSFEYTDIDEEIIPNRQIVLSNFPNPFNSETTISFSLTDEKAESTEICIYNIKGQKVKQFPDIENQNSITWNATDEYDKQVSNGVYFYKLRVNNINKAVRKMILIR